MHVCERQAGTRSMHNYTTLIQQRSKHTSCFLAFTCVRVAQDYSLSFFLEMFLHLLLFRGEGDGRGAR